MPTFYLLLYDYLKPKPLNECIFSFSTQIPTSLISSEGIRRTAQILVVPGCITLLCHKLLL